MTARRRFWAAAVFSGALALIGQASSAATVRALFVGIDTYKNSAASNGRIANLDGPDNDVALIKQVLRDTKHLALDPLDPSSPVGTNCRGEGEAFVSITLVEQCATHDAIVTALDAQIVRSTPGDILLFYFAGHGTTYEDEAFDQSNGENDSIEPYDSGEPNVAAQILDAELRVKIDGALARGVSVVTIFDSCHSGTATRALDGAHARRILPGPVVPLPLDRLRALRTPIVMPPQVDGVRAYRVHLAAAADSELAEEYPYGTITHGAFTKALADAIREMPDATYGDIMRVVGQTVRKPTTSTQTPQIEGALVATFLGPDPGNVRLYDAIPLPSSAVQIAGGSLSGITAGSTFAVFADMSSAVAPDAKPLATGIIADVSAGAATLQLDKDPGNLPATLQVRERDHRFVAGAVKVAVRFDSADDPNPTISALRRLDMVNLVDKGADLILASVGGEAAVQDGDGRIVQQIGRIDDPLFQERVAGAIRIVARYREMLALATTSGPSSATIAGQPCDGMPDSGVCVTRNCIDLPDGVSCALLRRTNGAPVFAPGDRFLITVRNITKRPQYLYLFDLEPSHFSVTPFTPPGSKDIFLPGKSVQFTGKVGAPGRAQLLLLATENWINLAALAQDGLSRDTDPLARLLQAAESGTRAIDPPSVGTWTGTITSLCVTDPNAPAQGEPSCGPARSH